MTGTTRLSEAQAREKDLRAMPTALDDEPEWIARLKDYAMNTPESRKRIMTVLKEYEENCGDLRTAAAAHCAISTILAVSMLEALQGDRKG